MICRHQLLALALTAFGCASCSTTPADRVHYGIAAIEMACEVAEKHPAEVPPKLKAELDEICLALAAREP